MSLPQSITDTLNTLGLPPLNQTLQPMMPEDNAPIPIRQLHRNPEKPLSGQYYSRNLADSYKMTTMPHHSTSHSSQSFRPSQTYFSSHEQRDRSSSPPHLGSQTERIAYSNWEERRTPSVDYTSPPPPLVHVPTTPRSRGPQIPLLSPKVVSLKKFKTRKERTLSPRPVVMTSASPRDEGGKDSTSIQSPTPSPTNMFPAMCSTIGIQTEPIVITSPTDDDNNVTERSVPNDALQHSLDSLAHLRRQLEEMTQSFNEEQARRMAIENQFESEKALWTGAQSDLSQDQSELLDKLRQLQIEGANQQTRFEDLSRQLEQSNQHRDQLEETITSLREQLREAKTETEMWSVQCDERGNEIQTLQDLLKSSNSDAERLKSEAQQLQGELYQKNTQLRTLKSQHAELEKENEELRRRLERDNTDVSIQTNWFIASESVSQLVAIQSKKQPPAPPDPTETQTYENLDDVDGVVVFTESDGRLLREFKELLDQSHHKDSVDLSVTPPDILPNSNQPPLVPMPATPSEQDPVKQNQDKSLVKTPKLGKSRMNRKQQSSAQQLSKYQSSTTQLPRTKMKAEETTIPPELARVLRELQDTERFRRTEKDVTAVFDWSGMNDRSLKQRFYAEDYEVDNVDYIVISAAALLRFTRNIISEQKKLSDSVDLIRTQFLKVVELFCRAYRQTSHHLGSITTLVDEIETVNSAMTVDLTCSSCLTILKDPITFIPCGHTLCRICAYKYGKQGKTQCPRCSDSDNVTRGYIRNYLVESLTTREEVKRQRMDETRLSNSQLAVTQALLEESVLTLPNARSIMDRYDEGLLASSDQFQT
ncbi:hypothetical protein BLNAU_7380 [Blattamonas nauphoetae]|uniref:RING-type domain-containing protein n=1 Tax=Blattamonas nauphoetae TaxID=2049346 RepID=A0ABQ9Y1X6_9EUKA|nr:hypothetical protein BLNAU_7380 [Blattamonas nauphoetae]